MDILQLSITVIAKNTRQQKRARQKPRRLVVTTAITTRKRQKRVPTPEKKKKTLENKYDQSHNFNKSGRNYIQSKLISGRSENQTD